MFVALQPNYWVISNYLQVALVVVIFNVTLGVGVFLPYVMGRTTSLTVVRRFCAKIIRF
jgi:hypothetical protein